LVEQPPSAAPDATAGEAFEPEWLDRPGLPAAERRRAIADLRRVNGILFGRRSVVQAVLEQFPTRGSGSGERTARGAEGGARLLLDVAAGSGDVGAAVGRALRRRGVEARIVALDREPAHLALGRRWGDIDAAVVARAEALPFRDASFDLTLSSLFFHHLDRAAKTSVSAEMLRVSRRGALIVDLVRSRWAGVALRLLFPLLGIGRVAREDGLVSIQRGWSVEEWRAFLEAGGAELRRRFPARVSILLRPLRASARQR
jgi:SAM-dependent methyltransferase